MESTQQLLLDKGVWLRPFGNLLYTMPPFISSEADIHAITSAMVDACAALAAVLDRLTPTTS